MHDLSFGDPFMYEIMLRKFPEIADTIRAHTEVLREQNDWIPPSLLALEAIVNRKSP
jgi:hypothetical protein